MSNTTNIDSPNSWDLGRVLRSVASGAVLMQAAYFLVVAFDNITNPQSNWVFVQGVLSLDGVFDNSGFEWRAINANWFHVLAYVALIAMETLTGILLTWAGVVGLKNATNRTGWGNAQRLTMLGVTTGLLVFFFGFITVGGNWFVMYLNSKWNGLDPAFQNTTTTFLTALLVLGVLIFDRFDAFSDRLHAASERLNFNDDK